MAQKVAFGLALKNVAGTERAVGGTNESGLRPALRRDPHSPAESPRPHASVSPSETRRALNRQTSRISASRNSATPFRFHNHVGKARSLHFVPWR